MQGTDISRLGSLGALNQAQTQAGLEATRQANQMAAYQPQEQIQNYANIVTGIMGGMAGSRFNNKHKYLTHHHYKLH